MGLKRSKNKQNWHSKLKNNYHARKEFWSSSLAVGSKEWIEGLAVYFPRNKRELSKVNSEVESKAMEAQSTYLLKTSKRNAVSFTRSLKLLIFDEN